MNESDLIELILARLGSIGHGVPMSVGPGDDAAVVSWEADLELVVSTDVVLDGVHVPKDCPGDIVGYRSVATSISDVVAMGATPRFLTIALTIENADVDWIAAFAEGVRSGCETAQTKVVGGNIAKGAKHVAITAFGSVQQDQALRRNTAQPDDDIWITGTLGASVLALQAISKWEPHDLATLLKQTSTDFFARYLLPPIRVNFVSCLSNCANACTDISDGLARELDQLVFGTPHGYRVNADAIPLWRGANLQDVLGQDDNYELLFTAPKNTRAKVLQYAQSTNTSVSRVGEILASSERVIKTKTDIVFSNNGYSHF